MWANKFSPTVPFVVYMMSDANTRRKVNHVQNNRMCLRMRAKT